MKFPEIWLPSKPQENRENAEVFAPKVWRDTLWQMGCPVPTFSNNGSSNTPEET